MSDMHTLTRRDFASLDELLAHVQKPTRWESPASQSEAMPDWYGNATFAEALAMARNGWRVGRDKLQKSVDAISAQKSLTTVSTASLDVAGAYPIAALAAAGDPACMVNPVPVEDQKRPIIRLLLQAGASASYQPAEITNYGAALCAILDGVEAAGFRVELIVAWITVADQRVFAGRTMLKAAEDALDVDRVAYCLTHASFLRRIGFAALEKEADLEAFYAVHYGRSQLSDTVVTDQPWKEEGELWVRGVNQFKPGGAELKTPAACLTALEPLLREGLADAGTTLPPLWGTDR